MSASKQDWVFWLAALAAALSLVSIAASQILLGAAIVAIVVTRTAWRAPRLGWAIVALFAWTAVSALASAEPAAGLPQIRKFYVWLMLPVMYTAVRSVADARRFLYLAAGVGAASAAWGLVQFARKWREAAALGRPFNEYYNADRITGFMSHWMTFGGGMLLVLGVLGAAVLFDLQGRQRIWAALTSMVVALAIVLGYTRSIWLAAGVAGCVLIWMWRRWVVVAVPVFAAALTLFAPEPLHSRIASIWRPAQSDSNLHREALRATGAAMIAARPMVGFGPEQVGRNVPAYMPQEYLPIPAHWWVGHLHNQVLHYSAERGLPAGVALLVFFGWGIWALARRQTDRFLRGAGLAAMAGILAGGLFEVNLGDSEVLALFLGIVGAGLDKQG